MLEIRVSDTGPGISEEDRKHLFEPFFTTRPQGTGLGLALCREIVLSHGGRIELEPGEGPGATFRVLLPAEGLGS
jgi:signal transduction histidine kinase